MVSLKNETIAVKCETIMRREMNQKIPYWSFPFSDSSSGVDLILSIVEQSRIRNAAVSHSENPEFNELMDAFCSPDGLQAVGKILDEKIKSTPDDESEKGKDQ